VPRGKAPQRTTEFTVLTKRRVQPEDRAATVRLGQVYLGLNRLRETREQFQSELSVFLCCRDRGWARSRFAYCSGWGGKTKQSPC